MYTTIYICFPAVHVETIIRRGGVRKGECYETTKSENVNFDGHGDLVPTHHWWTGYEINTKQTAILSLYRIYRPYTEKGVLMCHGVWDIEEPRGVTRVTAFAHIHA